VAGAGQQPDNDCKQMRFAHHFRLPGPMHRGFLCGSGSSVGLFPVPGKKLVEPGGRMISDLGAGEHMLLSYRSVHSVQHILTDRLQLTNQPFGLIRSRFGGG
jgi:hypothetical protein